MKSSAGHFPVRHLPENTVAAPALRPLYAALAAAILSVVVYWPSLGFGFSYDDDTLVPNDVRLAEPGFGYRLWVAPWWPAGTSAPASRPLTTFTYWVQVQLHGARAAPFHIVNVALFALLSAAVAWLTWRWLGSVAAAWIVGLIFAVHPIHVEAAVSIVGRAELLAGLFIVLGLLFYLRWQPGASHRTQIGWGRACMLGFIVLLAGLSKEHGYLLAVMIGFLELARRRREAAPLFARPLPWKLVTVILVVAGVAFAQRQAMIAQSPKKAGEVNETDNPLQLASAGERIVTPLKLVGQAAVLFVAPVAQSPDYSPHMLMPTTRLDDPLVLFGAAVLLAWAAAVGFAWTRRHVALGPLLMLPVAWFVPSNTLVIIGTIFGERLLTTLSIFVPIAVAAMLLNVRWPRPMTLVGLLVALGAAALFVGEVFGRALPYGAEGMLAPGWKIAVGLLVVSAVCAALVGRRILKVPAAAAILLATVIFSYGSATILYSGFWKDTDTLVLSTTVRHPESGRFRGFLAEKHLDRGRLHAERRAEFYAEAEKAAWEALERWPRQVRPYAVLAVVAQHRGDQERAEEYTRYALRAAGDDVYVRELVRYMGRGSREEQEQRAAQIEAQLQQDSGNVPLRLELAQLQVALGHAHRAIEIYKQLDSPPSTAPAFLRQYVGALLEARDFDGALEIYRRWIAASPNDHVPLTDAAFLAASAGDPGNEAVAWIERAMAISPGSSEPWAALGELHRNRGEAARAISAYEEAIRRTTPRDPKRLQYQLMIEKLRAG